MIAKIGSERFKDCYRTENRFFTRSRLFTFQTIILMQLNFISKSISVEVSKFLSKFHFSGKERDGSKQAFSKGRQHIKWEGYVDLNDGLVNQYYSDQDQLKYKKKYLLLATDGTNYQLPYEEELVKEFNEWDNGQGHPVCMAQGVKIYDVLNNIVIGSAFHPYNAKGTKGNSEKALFDKYLKILPELIDNEAHRVIIIGDKYYPNFLYFHQLPLQGYHYVFRCKETFCREIKSFAKSKQKDTLLTIDLTSHDRFYSRPMRRIKKELRPRSVSVRCVKIELKNGEIEYLLTNLPQKDLSRSDLKTIFGLRWKIETSLDTDKNKLEVENLSSKLPNGVRQDFHAKILASNITQLLIKEAQEQLEEEQSKKENKHAYQINRAVAIGLVKDELPKLFFGYESTQIWYDRMVKKILRRREPIRPGRHNPRRKKHPLKYSINKRRVT